MSALGLASVLPSLYIEIVVTGQDVDQDSSLKIVYITVVYSLYCVY